MACTIKKNVITITKGDTLQTKISIFDKEGNEYIPSPDDVIQFAVKKEYTDTEPLLIKIIDPQTLILRVEADETKLLEVGDYKYDIQITLTDGTVDTFIDKQQLRITEEVGD